MSQEWWAEQFAGTEKDVGTEAGPTEIRFVYGPKAAASMSFPEFCHRVSLTVTDGRTIVVAFDPRMTRPPDRHDAQDLINRIVLGQAEEDELVHFLRRIQ